MIVTKVEKISCIIHGLSLKIILYSIDKIKKVLYNTIDNQQRSPEEGKDQRLFRKEVGLQAIGNPKWCALFWGEDIV